MAIDHIDVLIVGAGLSGIGAAHHLQENCPSKSYAILESREAIGGTWDLFRYPGVRSDSDMYTLGYAFKPWLEAKAIADGRSILGYVRETAREAGIERHIRFNHKVVHAEWSSADARWTVQARRTDTDETVSLTCGFLLTCTGYYRYDEGYTPEFEGIERFGGQIVHPQHWPEDLDYAGKRIVVIGSGATAVTLIPAMAHTAGHVTMLQRSPTYMVTLPSVDAIADFVRRVLPRKLAYSVIRWKNVALTILSYQASRRWPKFMRGVLTKGVAKQLPDGYAVDEHFTPTYNPWDQRLCLVPDGDFFEAIVDGRASIVTDHIESFTESGIKLTSGAELEADIIITATGLNLLVLGGLSLTVDGHDLELSKTMAYKAMMLSGVPNMALTFGYTNASWTLKADLTSQYLCRLLNHMDARHYVSCTPRLTDPTITEGPFLDFNPGYVQRSIDAFPRQGSKAPWRLKQNYARDLMILRYSSLDDGTLEFASAPERVDAPEPVAA